MANQFRVVTEAVLFSLNKTPRTGILDVTSIDRLKIVPVGDV